MNWMNTFVNWISDKSNVSILIAVFGFIISVYNFVEARVTNRKKIDVSIRNTYLIDKNFLFIIRLTNRSKLPITITTGSILLPNRTVCGFGETSEAVFYYNNPNLSGKAVERTQRFPIKLNSYEAVTAFVKFIKWDDEWNKHIPCSCQITLGTSRGTIKKQGRLPVPCTNIKDMLNRVK